MAPDPSLRSAARADARRLGALSVALLALAPAAPATAMLIGDFEGGSLDGWSVSGNGSAFGTTIGISPTEGSGMLLLGTWGGSTPDDGTLDAFLGFATGDIDTLSPSGNPATEGSAVTLMLAASAGDVLSYDFNFLSSETLADASTYRDFFFSSIRVGEEGEMVRDDVLLMTRQPTASGAWSQSGWQSLEYTFTGTGTFRVAFGVVDVEDTAVSSAVMIDNIRKTPEPSTGLMLGLGLAAIALRRRRSRA